MKKLLSIFMISVAVSGCSGKDEIVSQNQALLKWDMSEQDELMAYAKIQMKSYQEEGFVEITNGETISLVGSDPIRVWVSKNVAENYKNLRSDYTFPIGSTVIRVLYDEESNVKKITASIKAAQDQNPDASDWVFAVADDRGVISMNDNGEWQFGPIASCNVCHVTRLSTDGLFGLIDN